MTSEEIRAILEAAPDTGQVKHVDFANWCQVMKRTTRETGEVTEKLYMQVDGKLAMCILDHANQEKGWRQLPPRVLEDSESRLTLMVGVFSEIHGLRFGIASSRRNGPSAEKSHPWETAETSALGRALVNMGYGLLPGTGRASADDVDEETPATKKPKDKARPKKATTNKKAKAKKKTNDTIPPDKELSTEEIQKTMHRLNSLAQTKGVTEGDLRAIIAKHMPDAGEPVLMRYYIAVADEIKAMPQPVPVGEQEEIPF